MKIVLNLFRTAYWCLFADTQYTMAEFLNDPDLAERKLYGRDVKLIRNSMAFDLGLENFDVTSVRNLIKEMEKKFVLVMITEYMDESLVMLRRLMCWNHADLYYYALKVKKKKKVKK